MGLEPWQLASLREALATGVPGLRRVITCPASGTPGIAAPSEFNTAIRGAASKVLVELRRTGFGAIAVELDCAADGETLGFVLGSDPSLKDLRLRPVAAHT